MRNWKTWSSNQHEHQATAEAQASLAKEFMLEGTVGDQDWLTFLAWKQPQLVYLLPCQFNVQTDQVLFILLAIKGLTELSQVYNTAKWAHLWDKYRNCPNQTMIRHDNGE